MQNLQARMASKNYQPVAEDRHAWLEVLETLVKSGENREGLQNAFDCLVDSSGDAEDPSLLRRATELANEIVALCEPVAACLVLYSCSNAWAHLYALEHQEQR
ncbi:hypothetical protein A262_03915 [Pseudomonas syringae pv. actinidiae ICMP 19073]|nr:hypothetical protein A262_03915 [Pseudomonas syringae pv. actinidiae ICMP 19073]